MENYIVDNQVNNSVSSDEVLRTFYKIQELRGLIDFGIVDPKITDLINEIFTFMMYFNKCNLWQEQKLNNVCSDGLLLANYIADRELTEDFIAYIAEKQKQQ